MKQRTQKDFDVSRYLGSWYDIGHSKDFPWQRSCILSLAEYSWDSIKNVMKVKNTCLDGNRKPLYSRFAEARVVNPADASKLRIVFNDGLPADPEGWYWVLYTDYDKYSIVSSGPDRQYIWILAREKQISAKDVPMLLEKIKSFGFNPDQIVSNPKVLY